jgi:molybdopterin-containing oxidoreductase family iron-sulfur binding subunit
MYKSDEGLTLHDVNKCIGCRLCQLACPYGVIYFNENTPFAQFHEDEPPAIAGGTATGPEIIAKTETPIPDYNPASRLGQKGVVEKCNFCSHRLEEDKLPWCVESCPADARIFGDLNDPESPPSRALARHSPRVLQKEKGTRPRVFYIRDF